MTRSSAVLVIKTGGGKAVKVLIKEGVRGRRTAMDGGFEAAI
ncbi:MAG: hypothetical protein QXP31_05275 [Pyrobaculum sp.]